MDPLDALFAIYFKRDITAGYSTSVCLECKNAVQAAPVQQDNWLFTQTANPCPNTLTLVTGPSDINSAYDSSHTGTSSNIFISGGGIFANSDASTCPHTCTLKS